MYRRVDTSLDWRERGAKPHPLKKVPKDILSTASDLLSQILLLQSE